MPWDDATGTRYTYDARAVISTTTSYKALMEHAAEDPASMGACCYYDLLKALDALQVTPRQFEALCMQLTGAEDVEIGYAMGLTHVTVKQLLRRPRRAIKLYLSDKMELLYSR